MSAINTYKISKRKRQKYAVDYEFHFSGKNGVGATEMAHSKREMMVVHGDDGDE